MLLTRVLLFTLTFGILAAPLAPDAQPQRKAPQIGFLAPSTPLQFNLDAFRQGLREHGYVEGQNLAIEYRSADGRYERLPELAAELVRLQVDVIVALGTPTALAAKDATRTIPIVMLAVGDPVGTGLVTSLARPGGNITGVSLLAPELVGKQLQLLTEATPKVSRVAILSNPGHALHPLMLKEAEASAQSLGLHLQILKVRDPNEFDGAFSAMTGKRVAALLVLPDPTFFRNRSRIGDLAAKGRLPWAGAEREYAEAGALISYAWNLAERHRRAAYYVDRILKGTKPADLPVEQPTKFELVVNLKTAKALGLTIPQSILIRADEVIQ